MKKVFAIVALVSLALVFGCSDSSSNSDEVKNAFKVGNKFSCPLKLLTESLFDDEIYVYLDGGNSSPDFETGKWSGNGPRMMFVFKRLTKANTDIPTGTLTLGENISEIKYCENYNNDGEVYTPVYDFKDGILKSTKSGTNYIFNFTGVDQNDSIVIMNFTNPVSYVFDWANEH